MHSFIILFFHLVNKYFLTIYCVSGPALGTRNLLAKKEKSPLLRSLHTFQEFDVYTVFSWHHLADILMKVDITSYVQCKTTTKTHLAG